MNNTTIIKMNEIFDKLNDETNIEYILQNDIDRYVKLKEQLYDLEKQINTKANPYGLYFNTNSCLLDNLNKTKLFIKKYFKINKKEEIEVEKIEEISDNTFKLIEKYLKNDKEKIVQFLNNRELKDLEELSDIPNYVKYFFCGICSENNIIEIKEKYNQNNDFIIYTVKFHQVENKIENIYGEISFILR